MDKEREQMVDTVSVVCVNIVDGLMFMVEKRVETTLQFEHSQQHHS